MNAHDVHSAALTGKTRPGDELDREDELMRQLAERARTQRLQQQRVQQQRIGQIPAPAAAGLPRLARPPGRYAPSEPPALAVPPLTTYREGRLTS